MYEYFPDNYAWSLTTATMIDEVGTMTEVDDALQSLKPVAGGDHGKANEAWYQALTKAAEKQERLAERDEKAGHPLTAARKWHRAGVYHLRAERFMQHTDPREILAYKRGVETFRHARELAREPVEYLDVPWQDGAMPCMFVKAPVDGPAPCMIHIQGFDSLKEFHHPIVSEAYRRRGIHMLIVDQPGAGGALRLHGLTTNHETEHFVAALVDYVETRADCDPKRIGLSGNSLGGYYAPRAACFEKRLAACIAWGAIWDFGVVLGKSFENIEKTPSIPDMVKHAMWVFGQDSPDGVRAVAEKMTLAGVIGNMTCPLFVVHGENDRQVPLHYAQASYDGAVNAASRELKVFSLADGGSEHCQVDHGALAIEYMTDWIAETFGTRTA